MRRPRLRPLVLVALTAGCGASVTASPPVASFDAGTADAGSPWDDYPATPDAPALDQPPPVDATPVAASTLTGTWRAVRWEGFDASGREVITDVDAILPHNIGDAVSTRINGVLSLGESRLVLTFGRLDGGHFLSTALPASDAVWTGGGATVPGRLSVTNVGAVFEGAGDGGRYRFERTADDALVLLADGGARTTFVRDPHPPRATASTSSPSSSATAPAAPAPAPTFRWDLPGAATVRTADVALEFPSGWYAPFPVALPGPAPAAVVAPVGGVSVAVAFVEPYDDANRNGHYDPGVDVPLGGAPFGVAWRGPETPTDDFARSACADLVVGWQVVSFHRDPADRWVATPFDNTHVPAPDATLAAAFVPTPVELR